MFVFQVSVYMHLISLGLLRFVDFMSVVYIDEEFDEATLEKEEWPYYRRQVNKVNH